MELHVSAELEAKLTHSANKQGRSPDELLQDVLTRYFEEEAGFVADMNRRSGAALVEVMQASPYKDIDLQPTRDRPPVRDAFL